MHPKCWFANVKGRDHLGDLEGNIRIILKCIYEKYDIKIRTRNRISTARFCEYSNEPWGSEGGGDIVTS
jgi:hypothetical protein